MPVRGFLLFICIAVFLATTFARAEDCSCPPVQCEPCQKKLILGADLKECKNAPAIVCQKVVCENVDNYFHCIAGTDPLYIPPQDPSQRYTEPRYTPTDGAKPKTPVQFADKPAPKPVTASQRLPSSFFKEKEEHWQLVLSRVSGDVVHGKKSLPKKSQGFGNKIALKAKKPSHVSLKYGPDVIEILMAKEASLELEVQDGVVFVQSLAGEVRFSVEKSRDLFIADIGDWRFGKKSGTFKIKKGAEDVTVENHDGEAYLRRKVLISQSDSIAKGKVLHFQLGENLYTSTPLQNETVAAEYVLHDAVQGRDKRAPAADAFCQQPEGQYEQCAWKCFGAGAQAKTCAGPRATGQCVRFTCSADGSWKLPTVVSEGECALDKIHVGICH